MIIKHIRGIWGNPTLPKMQDKMRETIANNLKKYIELTGKEQAEIAIDLGINRTTFNQWCVGNNLPSIIMLVELANYFHCTIYDLISDDDIPFDSRFRPYMNEDTLDLVIRYSNAEEWQKKAVNKILGG